MSIRFTFEKQAPMCTFGVGGKPFDTGRLAPESPKGAKSASDTPEAPPADADGDTLSVVGD